MKAANKKNDVPPTTCFIKLLGAMLRFGTVPQPSPKKGGETGKNEKQTGKGGVLAL